MRKGLGRLGAGCLVALVVAGCGPSEAEVVRQEVAPAEDGLNQLFLAVETNDPSEVLRHVTADEKAKYRLDEAKAGRLLALYHEATKGLMPGKMIVDGDADTAVGQKILRRGDVAASELNLVYYHRSGKENGGYVVYGLVEAIAMARGHATGLPLSTRRERAKALLVGLPKVRPELEAVGIDKMCDTAVDGRCRSYDAMRALYQKRSQ